MKFTTKRADVVRATRLATGIANRTSTMPILHTVLLQPGERVTIAATDMQVFLQAHLPVTAKGSEGVCVNAKEFHEVVNSCADEDLYIGSDKYLLSIQGGKARCRLNTVSGGSFPLVPRPDDESEWLSADARALGRLLERTVYASPRDDVSTKASGVHLQSDGKRTTAVAIDGHRLARAVEEVGIPIPDALKTSPGSPGLTIPAKGASELSKLLQAAEGECRVAATLKYLFVEHDGIELAVKLLETDYPDYEQVMPQGTTVAATMWREDLQAAVKRCQIVAKGEMAQVQVEIDADSVDTYSHTPDKGEISDTVKATVKGEPTRFALNPRYILEFLARCGEEYVTVEGTGELDPVLFRDSSADHHLAVMMPMKS